MLKNNLDFTNDLKIKSISSLSERVAIDWLLADRMSIADIKQLIYNFGDNNIKPDIDCMLVTGMIKEICGNTKLWYDTVNDSKENLKKLIKKDNNEWWSNTNQCTYEDHEITQPPTPSHP